MNEWIDAETRVERARRLYDEARWAEAAAELKAAIAVNPYNPGWLFNLGLTLDAMEDYDHAYEAYKDALDLFPDDLDSLNCLGVNRTRAGRYDEALEYFQRIERIDWTYEPGYCNRIITYTEMGDHQQAELMFYLARQVKDECPLCCYNVGSSLYARGKYDRAISCWRETLRLAPSHPQVYARIAEAYWAQGDLASARKHFEAELAENGDDAETMVDLGELLIDSDELARAEKMFRKALKQDPRCPGGYFGMGEISLKRGRLTAAEVNFRQVLALDRSYPGAHGKLGEVLLLRGRRKQAEKQFDEEIELSRNDPASLQRLGQFLLDVRWPRRANQVWKRLVALRPDDPHALHNLAVSCFLVDRLDEGIGHCRKALKLKPHYPLALYNLALAHVRKGRIHRARCFIARAARLAPDDQNIRKLSVKLGLGGLWSKLRARVRGFRRRR